MSASKNLGKVFMTPKGIWDKNSNYTKLDIVTNKVGKISCGYIATTDIEKNIEITDNRWLKLFELLDGDLTEEYKAVQTDVTNKATDVDTNKKAVDLIYSQMQKLYDVEISTTTPTNERTGLWINPDDISGVINIPEIRDDEVSDVDTWSSKKIDNVTSSLKEDLDNMYEDIDNIFDTTSYWKNITLTIEDNVRSGIDPSSYAKVGYHATTNVKYGEKIKITGRQAQASFPCYIFLNDEDSIISSGGTDGYNVNIELTVPIGATKITINNDRERGIILNVLTKYTVTEEIILGGSPIAIFIGDSYVQGNSLGSEQNKRFSTVLCERMNMKEKNYAVGGTGFITGTTKFIDQLTNAINDNSYDHNKVKYVFVCGGRNDAGSYGYMNETIVNAVNAVIDSINNNFPKATPIIIPMMWNSTYIKNTEYPLYQTIIYACQSKKACVIPNAYTWLTGMFGMILSDNVHPNVQGHSIISSHIMDSLISGNSFAYPSSVIIDKSNDSISSDAYFTATSENGIIRFNSSFTISSPISANTTLFSKTVTDAKNIPAYIGNYGRTMLCRNQYGNFVTLRISCTLNDNGYSFTVQNANQLVNGNWEVQDETMPFGLQMYASYQMAD